MKLSLVNYNMRPSHIDKFLPVSDPSPQPMWKNTMSSQVKTGTVMQCVQRKNHLLVSAYVITVDYA